MTLRLTSRLTLAFVVFSGIIIASLGVFPMATARLH